MQYIYPLTLFKYFYYTQKNTFPQTTIFDPQFTVRQTRHKSHNKLYFNHAKKIKSIF